MIEKSIFIKKEKINSLPHTAGVYLFYAGKELIYIGKAINLRERVKNHFMQPTYKDRLFINSITKIDILNTNSEIEALVLEATLIKKNQPRFNVVWRDDKNYFYVAIEENSQKIPFLYITHQFKLQDTRFKIQHIGPFVEGNALKKILKYLRRVFPFYTTSKHPKTACTWCHLGLCPGPNPDMKAYKNNLKRLVLILQGKRKTVFYALRREMELLAKANKFEEAGKVRDRMNALQNIMEHTHVIESKQLTPDNWHLTEKNLQEILSIKKPISKIECYDISNIQGKNAVGSMVVFMDGAPDKSQYKKFSIRVTDASDPNLQMTFESTNTKKRPYELLEEKPNDIAMLKQILTRRLLHPEWGFPQIMLIDGGIAQLNVAIRAKNAATETKSIKIISIAKGKRELWIENPAPASSSDKSSADKKAMAGKGQTIPLKNLPQDIYNLIVHMDDEAHRFAITYHKKLRKKGLLNNN